MNKLGFVKCVRWRHSKDCIRLRSQRGVTNGWDVDCILALILFVCFTRLLISSWDQLANFLHSRKRLFDTFYLPPLSLSCGDRCQRPRCEVTDGPEIGWEVRRGGTHWRCAGRSHSFSAFLGLLIKLFHNLTLKGARPRDGPFLISGDRGFKH